MPYRHFLHHWVRESAPNVVTIPGVLPPKAETLRTWYVDVFLGCFGNANVLSCGFHITG